MFLFEGVLGISLVAALLWRAGLWKRLLLAIAVLAALYFTVDSELTVRTRGDWWEAPIWRNIVLFVLLLLGMAFRVVWEALDRRDAARLQSIRSVHLRLTVWDFIRPALVALLVFQGVLFLAKSQQLSWELALASFQNGFFWNTLFNRTRSAIEGSPGTRTVALSESGNISKGSTRKRDTKGAPPVP